MQFAELLRKHLAGILEPSDAQIEALTQHYDLLVHWNQRLNLTAIRNLEDAVIRHYCESLFFASHLPEAESILDFGSGAGFPGIPMAIWRPDWRLTLAESHQRKAVFLREASRSLPNVKVEAKRAEELSGRFDFVVSRAVSPTTVLETASSLAKNVGLMIGKADVETVLAHPGIRWSDPVAMPWGMERVCVYGCFT